MTDDINKWLLRPPTGDRHWRNLAACKHGNPDWWFPSPGPNHNTPKAKQVCARCPVAGDCALFAAHNKESFGIWGGLTEKTGLRQLRKALRISNESRFRARDGVKTCSKCEKTKPVDSFSADAGTRDGFQYWCLACKRISRPTAA